jgi:hypothetical protein
MRIIDNRGAVTKIWVRARWQAPAAAGTQTTWCVPLRGAPAAHFAHHRSTPIRSAATAVPTSPTTVHAPNAAPLPSHVTTAGRRRTHVSGPAPGRPKRPVPPDLPAAAPPARRSIRTDSARPASALRTVRRVLPPSPGGRRRRAFSQHVAFGDIGGTVARPPPFSGCPLVSRQAQRQIHFCHEKCPLSQRLLPCRRGPPSARSASCSPSCRPRTSGTAACRALS